MLNKLAVNKKIKRPTEQVQHKPRVDTTKELFGSFFLINSSQTVPEARVFWFLLSHYLSKAHINWVRQQGPYHVG